MALRHCAPVGVAILSVVGLGGGPSVHTRERSERLAEPASSTSVARMRALQAPMVFEPNVGQASSSAAFVARGRGYSVVLTANEARLALRSDAASPAAALSMAIVGGSQSVALRSQERQPGESHYFIGTDPRQYRTGVPQFGRVEAPAVYPHIDLAYYGNGDRLEYDFIVAPGGDPARIQLRFSGHEQLTLDEDGGLTFRWGAGELRQPRPVAYVLPGRERVDSRFVRLDDDTVGFAVADWDHTKTLVIDPTVVFGTYLGGTTNADQVGGVAVDLDGNIYVAGFTASTNFPVVGGAQGIFGGGQYDAFVTKMNASGTSILYSTYLGGNDMELADGIAVDASGSAHVVGRTMSSNFPKVGPLGACSSFGGFVTKLAPAGNSLSYSYCVPGTWEIRAVGVDGSGSAYVAGSISGCCLPVVNAAQPSAANSAEAFVGKLNPAGSAWNYLTFLGGPAWDDALGLGVNAAGQVCVAGMTSGGFPVLNARQGTAGGADDAFVAKYDAAGARVFATYLGGTSIDVAQAAAIDAAGNCYVTGYTFSANFPVQNAVQPTQPGRRDAFVTAYTATGSAYVYSTFIGGTLGADAGLDLTVSSTGVAHVVGETGSRDFPILSPLQNGLHDVGGVAASSNGGTSFAQSLRDITVQALAVDPTDSLVQYAGTADGIYRTLNGGVTWTRVDGGLIYTDVRALAIDPNAHCTVYAGIETFLTNIVTPTFIQVRNTNSVLVRSLDCGTTWGIPAGGPSGSAILKLAFGPGSPAPLHFAIHVNGVSGNSSLTFPRVGRWVGNTTDFSFLFDDFEWVVAADYTAPCTSYAGGSSGQVRINSSCGTPSWSTYGAPLVGPVRALAGHPSSPGTMLAGTGSGRIYRKPDVVSAWQLVATIPGAVNAVMYQPGSPQTRLCSGTAARAPVGTDGTRCRKAPLAGKMVGRSPWWRLWRTAQHSG